MKSTPKRHPAGFFTVTFRGRIHRIAAKEYVDAVAVVASMHMKTPHYNHAAKRGYAIQGRFNALLKDLGSAHDKMREEQEALRQKHNDLRRLVTKAVL